MIAVAIGGLVVALVTALVLERILARANRDHARAEKAWEAERLLLIEQMCVLAGKDRLPQARAAVLHQTPERSPDPDADLALY